MTEKHSEWKIFGRENRYVQFNPDYFQVMDEKNPN
jgi:hypothetical protein